MFHFQRKHQDQADCLIRQEIVALVEREGHIDWPTYESLRMNSYERHFIHEYLTNDALLKLCHVYFKNFTTLMPHNFPTTYEQVWLYVLSPLLVERFERMHQEDMDTIAAQQRTIDQLEASIRALEMELKNK